MASFDYLNEKGIEAAVLVFDGLKIYKNDVTDIARGFRWFLHVQIYLFVLILLYSTFNFL